METVSAIALLLYMFVLMLCGASCGENPQLRRQKRNWVIPSKMLKENFDYRNSSYVARIRSDQDEHGKLYYSLTGPGTDKKPYNLFRVEEATGLVYVHGILDREERETYILTGVARYHNGTVAEGKIELRFDVMDENDNPPVFPSVLPVAVNESSPPGTLVGTFKADDADKNGTPNAKISYSIIKQEPAEGQQHFYIDQHTGSIYVKELTLDRERQGSYSLTVKGVDMDGAPSGKSGTGTIEIKVIDINDNVPTLEKDEYMAEIVENVAHVEVMKIKAMDADEEKTDNWLAVFDIVAGNEDGIFSIKTDPDTNEGILMLEKPVNFEETPDIKLSMVVANVAPAMGEGWGAGAGGDGGGGGDGGVQGEGEGDGEGYGGMDLDLGLGVDAGGGANVGLGAGATGAAGGASGAGHGAGTAGPGGGMPPKKKKRPKKGKVYAVNIAVQNEPEGAAFKPSVMPVSVSENPEENPADGVIAVYPATDTDTGQPAENVIYVKGYDPDNLLQINPKTAEIKLQRAPDRESPFVVNGTYFAKILSMTKDLPSKTATGTIVLQVGDANDNCPTLTTSVEYICWDTRVVNITGQDKDADPNGGPFSFSVVAEKSSQKWRLESLDGINASLHALTPLWPGVNQVFIMVYDRQGLACPEPQTLELHVCSCENGDTCEPAGILGGLASLKESAAAFGGLGAAVVLLSLLALLIAAFLLTSCRCGGVPESFSDIPFSIEDHLMVYHTEGQGEDKDVPLLSSPVHVAPAVISNKSTWTTNQANMSASYNMGTVESGSRFETYGRLHKNSFGESRESQLQVSLLTEDRLQLDRNTDFALPKVFLNEYYSQKLSWAAVNENTKDSLLVYEYEGQGSPAGSVSCSSSLPSDDDLQFLNDLEPKFKTLAEICVPPSPQPAPKPPTSSTHPTVQVHHPLTASVPPTLSAPKEMHLQTKNIQTSDSNLSRIHRQSLVHDQTISTMQESTSQIHNEAAALHSNPEQYLKSTHILQSPPMNRPTAAPPLGQTLVLQQQPIYYITYPDLQPTSPVLQPTHYMVQPQIQNTVLLAEAQAPTLQGLVLLHNSLGSAEHTVHMGYTAGTLGRRRIGSVFEGNQQVEAEVASGSQNPGVIVGRKGRALSEGWINLEGFNSSLATGASAKGLKEGQGGRKNLKEMMLVEEVSEQCENSAVFQASKVTKKKGRQAKHRTEPYSESMS